MILRSTVPTCGYSPGFNVPFIHPFFNGMQTAHGRAKKSLCVLIVLSMSAVRWMWALFFMSANFHFFTSSFTQVNLFCWSLKHVPIKWMGLLTCKLDKLILVWIIAKYYNIFLLEIRFLHEIQGTHSRKKKKHSKFWIRNTL
jgi:hypothetical protein